ncbi:hypothetical protein L0F63_004486 [Massospora cicadina]|nr:hypothetical protein L0F63_004486 [Massospora cicadina]
MAESKTQTSSIGVYGNLAAWLSRWWQFSVRSTPIGESCFTLDGEKAVPVITHHPSFSSDKTYSTISGSRSFSASTTQAGLPVPFRNQLEVPIFQNDLIYRLTSPPSPCLQNANAKLVSLSEFAFGDLTEPYIQLEPLWDDFYVIESVKPPAGSLVLA